MANPVVEDITDWRNDATGDDTNLPASGNSAAIGGNQDLSGNLRLLKSEMRKLSLTMSWERWLGVKNLAGSSDVVFSFVSTTQFTVNDDFTATNRPIAIVGRRVRAFLSGSVIYGTITAASFSSPNTTVTVSWDSGTLNSSMTEIQFGNETQSLPTHKSTHATGGRDAFTVSDVLDAAVRNLRDAVPASYQVVNLQADEAHIAGNLLLRRSSDNGISSINYADSNAYGKRLFSDVDPVLGDMLDGDICYVLE